MLRISRLLYATEHACGRMNWLDSRWSAMSTEWTFIRHNIWWRRHGGFTFSVRVWHFNARSGFLEARAVEGRACVLDSKTSENDGCGVRTHALSDWRLKPAP